MYLIKSEACELGVRCQGVTRSSSEQTHHSCWGKVKSTQFLVSLSSEEAQCHCTVSESQYKASFSPGLLSLMRSPGTAAVCNFPQSNHWKSSFHSRDYSQCPLQMLTVTRHRRQEANSQIWKFEFTTYGSDCLKRGEDSGKITLKTASTSVHSNKNIKLEK